MMMIDLRWIVCVVILFHRIRGEATSADDFLVKGLEDIEPAYASFAGKMYAGLIPVDLLQDHEKTGGKFMFWLFVPNHQSVPDTMVLWLNGGPGCSSILGGVLLENSPVTLGPRPTGSCCLSPADPLRSNANASWTLTTTMLYLEQPTGVGFSTGGVEPQNEDDVGLDVYGFLRNFYNVFSHLQPYRLSIFGESYAGYFVPAIAHRIALENDRVQSHNQKKNSATLSSEIINLDGIGLGNGWMDATVQGPAVIDYAWWHGMIDEYTRDAFHAEWERCYGAFTNAFLQDEPWPFHTFTTPDECGIMPAILTAAGKGALPHGMAPNTYDVTTFDPYNVIAASHSTFHDFMNNPLVKKALHAPTEIEWFGCEPGQGRRRLALLDRDEPLSMVPYLARLLDRWNVRVFVYNGDLDMSVNPQGSEQLLNRMTWSGHESWKVATRGIWMTDNDTVAGYVKQHSNLTFLVVKNSGHLVPLNKPAQALNLIERYLQDSSFLDIELPSFVSPPPKSERSFDSQQKQIFSLQNQHASWREQFQWKLVQVLGAILCFLAGFLASNSWRRREYQELMTIL